VLNSTLQFENGGPIGVHDDRATMFESFETQLYAICPLHGRSPQ
jgi:hypothetical protein